MPPPRGANQLPAASGCVQDGGFGVGVDELVASGPIIGRAVNFNATAGGGGAGEQRRLKYGEVKLMIEQVLEEQWGASPPAPEPF